jgi:hypothetical protein
MQYIYIYIYIYITPSSTVSRLATEVAFNLGHVYPVGIRKHLTSNKTKHRNSLKLEPALTLALRKIRPELRCKYDTNKLNHLINRSELH